MSLSSDEVEVVLTCGDSVVVSALREPDGHRIQSSSYGFMSPSPTSVYFLETLSLGEPWIRIYPATDDGNPDLTTTPTRMPISKRRVIRIVRR